MVHRETFDTQLFPIAGPIRKPKYVESPRVPGEAGLLLRKGAEQGEPSQTGKNLFNDTWFRRTAIHFRVIQRIPHNNEILFLYL